MRVCPCLARARVCTAIQFLATYPRLHDRAWCFTSFCQCTHVAVYQDVRMWELTAKGTYKCANRCRHLVRSWATCMPLCDIIIRISRVAYLAADFTTFCFKCSLKKSNTNLWCQNRTATFLSIASICSSPWHFFDQLPKTSSSSGFGHYALLLVSFFSFAFSFCWAFVFLFR